MSSEQEVKNETDDAAQVETVSKQITLQCFTDCIAITFALWMAVDILTQFQFNKLLLEGIRSSYYQATASSAAALLGLVLTAATMLLTVSADGKQKLFSAAKGYVKIFEAFSRVIFLTGATSTLAFVCLALDRDVSADLLPVKPAYCYYLSDLLVLLSQVSIVYLLSVAYRFHIIGKDYLLKLSKSDLKVIIREGDIPVALPWKGKKQSK